MTIAYIALGANVGDRQAYLQQALTLLSEQAGIQVMVVSSIYETEPVGYADQGLFLNMVAQVQTTLSARSLLETMLHIEQQLARRRSIPNGPRTIDLDLLLYDQQVMAEEDLQVPHPRMHERAFVLVPLQEIADQLTIPGQSQPLDILISEASDRDGLQVWRHRHAEDMRVNADDDDDNE